MDSHIGTLPLRIAGTWHSIVRLAGKAICHHLTKKRVCHVLPQRTRDQLTHYLVHQLDSKTKLVSTLHITFLSMSCSDAKEGSVEAHNFSADLSVTSLRSAKAKRVQETPAPTPTLAQSVYSIGTSKVTKDPEDNSDKEEEDAEMDGGSSKNEVVINRMDILHSDGKHGAMLFAAASMEETSELASKGEGDMEEDSICSKKSESTEEKEWQEEEKEASYLTAKMNVASARLHLGSDEEGSNYQEDDMSICSGNLDLTLQDYASNAQEVSSGKFDAAFTRKYANPKSFLHALWNAAGPSVVAMVICLDIIKEELEGQLAGVPAEFRDLPEQLINFMNAEAGEDPNNAMKFIAQISHQISQFEDVTGEEDNKRHVIVASNTGDASAEDALGTKKGGTQERASKTQGTLPRAQWTNPMEGVVNELAAEAGGDKEGVQSMSVAPGE
jgi:hypothetical protein